MPVKHKNIKMEVRSNTPDYVVLTVLWLLGRSCRDHSQWRAALQSQFPRQTITTVLPIFSEILEHGDSLPAATSLIENNVRPFLKWTAEPR